MKTFLFTIEDSFAVEGRGLILTPGPSRDMLQVTGLRLQIGSMVEVVKPDGASLVTSIRGMEAFSGRSDMPLMVESRYGKTDLAIGSQVFLVT